MLRRAKLRTIRGGDGQFYNALVSSNGEVLLTSEGYTRVSDADRAKKSAKKAARSAKIVKGVETDLEGVEVP